MNDSTFIWPRRDPIIGSFQKRSILPPQRKFLPSGGGGEKKLCLIIVNVLGHPKGVGRLTSYFLRGSGMDVFWNDPFVAGIPVCQDEKFSYKHSIIPARCGVFHLYIKHTILFCLAKFLSKVGLKPPVQPCPNLSHKQAHTVYKLYRRLYFTCRGARAAT